MSMPECYLRRLNAELSEIVRRLQVEFKRDPELLEILAAYSAIHVNNGIVRGQCEMCDSMIEFNTTTGASLHKMRRSTGGRRCPTYTETDELQSSKGKVC